MKITTLPNGFVLDLDSVLYIGSVRQRRHPFTGKPIDEETLDLYCEGNTFIETTATTAQSEEIQRVILNHLNERAKQ